MTQTVYKNAKERVICLSDKSGKKQYVLLDAHGRFVKELPSDFKAVDYVRQKRKLTVVAAT